MTTAPSISAEELPPGIRLAMLPEQKRRRVLGRMTVEEKAALLYDWKAWARPAQLPPPGDWRVWLFMAGRGTGKTRAGVEWVRSRVDSGSARRIALVAATAADARDIMVEGESGLVTQAPPWNLPLYEPSKRRLTWPNGAIATTYSADEPDRLRGPQCDTAWVDELAAWRYPDAWDQLLLGLRLGRDPRVVVTTTPRPIKIIRDLLADDTCAVTRGTTYDNRLFLAPAFLDRIVRRYEGTRLGRQELYAEVLDDTPGALWSLGRVEALRVARSPELTRVVVAIDPGVASSEDAAETGIVVAGLGRDRHGYVLADVSVRGTPDAWAKRAVGAYYDHKADRVVAEVNNGGEMVGHTIRTVDRAVPYRAVHASRGKHTRAEPVAALYEQGMVHHVGVFAQMEDQMCTWRPDMDERSPDRMDALVWAITELMVQAAPRAPMPSAGDLGGDLRRESPWKA